MLAAVEDDLQMESVPSLDRKELFQIRFGLNHILSIGQSPTLRQSVDVRIDRERRYAEGLGHDDRCRLMTDTRQPLQGFEVLGDLTGVLLNQDIREP